MAHSRASRPALAVAICGLLIVTSGCTHIQLKRNTIRQARTLSDIHQQQVLNNLAMFVYDYNSFPSFAIPNQGGSNVTDTGAGVATFGFSRTGGSFLFDALGFGLDASRRAEEAFTLTPVNDPRKLELMRCAYQKAVASCGCGIVSEHCPDCQTIMKKFYTGNPDGDISNTGGIVNSTCIGEACFFQVGCKKCIPKHCPCSYVGEYCGCCVYVMPEGRDELAKLTLAILDYAVNDPPQLRSKEVVYYIDEHGVPTTNDRSVGRVTAMVNIDEKPASLINEPAPDTAMLEQTLKAQLAVVNDTLAKADAQPLKNDRSERDRRRQLISERRVLENKLRFIEEQFRTDSLKNEYYPPQPSSVPGSLLLPFNLQQNTLTTDGPGRG